MAAFVFKSQPPSAQIGDIPGSSNLGAIRRVSLKDMAVQSIRKAIECGELESGEILTELGLARKLGVGQPTIREALLELEFIGYVESTPSRKTRVTYLTRRSIDDIYLVRGRLEALAVELLTAQKSPKLESCWEQLEGMETSAKGDNPFQFWHADLEFHRGLWRSSQNECLESTLEKIVPKLFAFGIIQHAHPNATELIEMCELHRRLLNVILKGDPETARQVMELSMDRAWLDDAQLPTLEE